MYLSQLILDSRSRQVRAEIANFYELHRTVMRAFPEKMEGAERVLFRLDLHPRAGVPLLLVQSPMQPSWDFLSSPDKNYLLPVCEWDDFGVQNPAVKPFDPQFQPGQSLRFRLRANPTVKKGREGKRNGQRVGLFHEEEQLSWLSRKLESAGAKLLSARVTAGDAQKGRLYHEDKPHELTVYTVQFDGELRVIDPSSFRDALQAGIGPAKGFGCGLLSLARA